MLKEPKQVPGDHRVVTFQKYTQYFVYGASWFNVDAPEESAALRACVHSLGLRYSVSHCSLPLQALSNIQIRDQLWVVDLPTKGHGTYMGTLRI